MKGLIRRFVAWGRGAIFGESVTRQAMEEVPSVTESVRTDEGRNPLMSVEPTLDDLAAAGTGYMQCSPASATVMNASAPDRWTVHPARESPFEKVGRVYVKSGDRVIRLDMDPRVYYIRDHDIDKALTDREGKVRTSGNSRPVGTTTVSTSGRALNIVIDDTLYTIPLRWLKLREALDTLFTTLLHDLMTAKVRMRAA